MTANLTAMDLPTALACGYIDLTDLGRYAIARRLYELELELGIIAGPLEPPPNDDYRR